MSEGTWREPAIRDVVRQVVARRRRRILITALFLEAWGLWLGGDCLESARSLSAATALLP